MELVPHNSTKKKMNETSTKLNFTPFTYELNFSKVISLHYCTFIEINAMIEQTYNLFKV